MEVRLKSFIKTSRGVELVDLFGYSSRSLPGIEIKTNGYLPQTLKEKILFLSRSKGIKFPAKRFILCFDSSIKTLEKESARELELSFLLLFWVLLGVISIHNLHQCIVNGQFKVNGEIIPLIPNAQYAKLLGNDQVLTWIGLQNPYFKTISIHGLLAPLSGLKIIDSDL